MIHGTKVEVWSILVFVYTSSLIFGEYHLSKMSTFTTWRGKVGEWNQTFSVPYPVTSLREAYNKRLVHSSSTSKHWPGNDQLSNSEPGSK